MTMQTIIHAGVCAVKLLDILLHQPSMLTFRSLIASCKASTVLVEPRLSVAEVVEVPAVEYLAWVSSHAMASLTWPWDTFSAAVVC